MVGISKRTVAFVKATDFLKDFKGIKHGDIADKMELSRGVYDQARGGRRKVTEEETNKLIRNFPEVISYFEGINDEIGDTVVDFYKEKGEDGELVEALRKTIKAQEEVIEMLKERLMIAKEAHADSLRALLSEEDLDDLYKKVQKMYKEIVK